MSGSGAGTDHGPFASLPGGPYAPTAASPLSRAEQRKHSTVKTAIWQSRWEVYGSLLETLNKWEHSIAFFLALGHAV